MLELSFPIISGENIGDSQPTIRRMRGWLMRFGCEGDQWAVLRLSMKDQPLTETMSASGTEVTEGTDGMESPTHGVSQSDKGSDGADDEFEDDEFVEPEWSFDGDAVPDPMIQDGVFYGIIFVNNYI